MSFMEPEVVFGRWIEIDGNQGTEFVDADLVGEIEPYDGPAIPVPSELSDYTENRTVTQIKIIEEGWGARFSAPGYLDCTPWCVFATAKEAQAYLDEQADEEDDE